MLPPALGLKINNFIFNDLFGDLSYQYLLAMPRWKALFPVFLQFTNYIYNSRAFYCPSLPSRRREKYLYAFERGAFSRSALLLPLPSSEIIAAWITQFNSPRSKAFIFSDYFVSLLMISCMKDNTKALGNTPISLVLVWYLL